jgi:hypothetical protein
MFFNLAAAGMLHKCIVDVFAYLAQSQKPRQYRLIRVKWPVNQWLGLLICEHRMKTKLVVIAIVLALGVFAVNSHLEKKSKREAQKAEALRIQQETKTTIEQVSSRHNAVSDWEKQLSRGESYRLSRILTIELEQLWRGEQPILFIGSIRDISSAGADAYQILVEKSLFNTNHIFSTELRLFLNAPKATIDSFIQKYPTLIAEDSFNNGIAVVAKIHTISTSDEHDNDGERVEVKTGLGDLLDLVYVGDVLF